MKNNGIPIKATLTIHTELGDLVSVLWDYSEKKEENAS